jgi:murein DD-endopeptidase MepM/ murein hydrolase activator NlpD
MARTSGPSRRVWIVASILCVSCPWLLWLSCNKSATRAIVDLPPPRRTTRSAQYTAGIRKLMDLVNNGKRLELYNSMDKECQAQYSYDKLSRDIYEIVRRRGLLVSHASPVFTGDTARIPVRAERGEWIVKLSLDTAGRIRGFYFDEPRSSIPVPSRNAVRLRLPFDGEWVVISGGDDPSKNDHTASGFACEARALDFAIRDSSGALCRRLGARNEDYYCYNQPIVAPADGVVCVVVDGVPDNRPGSINPTAAAGNTVLIRHVVREYSVFCHLRPGSITVKVGDRVTTGQTLGRCGNSGNAASPHLHFHLMNSDVPIEATGFSPYFERVMVRREGEQQATMKEDYTPSSGDFLRQSTEPGKSTGREKADTGSETKGDT